MTRILIDLTTSLAWRGRKAVGIIRTEREIALRLLDDPSLVAVPFRFNDTRLEVLDLAFARAMLGEDSTTGAPAPPNPWYLPLLRLAALARRIVWRARILFLTLVRALARSALKLVPARARGEIGLSTLHLKRAIRASLAARRPRTSVAAPTIWPEPVSPLLLHAQPGDVIFTCGLTWDYMDWAALAALKAERGIRIVCVCYDLIPILFRQWLMSPQDLYLSHFLSVIDIADAVPCISQTTERDLLAFAAKHGRPAPATSVVILGADLPAAADSADIGAVLAQRLSAGRFALTVGVFEVRKNYKLLLDLWDELVKDPGFDLDLVIVGLRGWLADDVIKRLELSPLLGRRIHWLSNLSDGGLSWLYRECHVMLYPSLYEGWGLPVVEALLQRRPVIASNRGAIPEAGMGIATIIDPDDFPAWISAVTAIARAPRRQTPAIDPPSWDKAAASIRATLLQTGAGTSAP